MLPDMNKQNKIYMGVVTLITTVVLGWLYYESVKPLPGMKIDDLGREHVNVGTEVTYNSNPPTSGSHYGDPTKFGVYGEVQDDRNIVHSIEHGYVVMSYNCDHPEKTGWIPGALAHEGEEFEVLPTSNSATQSASLSVSFQSDSCKELVSNLTSIYNKKGQKRIIVVPRPSLDTRIALTAWNYLDKFDNFDAGRIEYFIDKHIDNGPEKIVE